MSKQLESQLGELNAKLDDSAREISELQNQKSRLQAENSDLTRQLEEAESQVNQLTKAKQNLTRCLEEAKGSLEDESRVRFICHLKLICCFFCNKNHLLFYIRRAQNCKVNAVTWELIWTPLRSN